jgi:predicted ATPase
MAETGGLDEAVDAAFPGAILRLNHEDGRFSFSLKMPGLNRSFDATELSDGTLQYLCMLAALMTARPPGLMVFNEPETSIHPDLFEALAKSIAHASEKSQMIVTTHSRDLANFLKKHGRAKLIEFEKVDGETRIVGAKLSADEDEELEGSDN